MAMDSALRRAGKAAIVMAVTVVLAGGLVIAGWIIELSQRRESVETAVKESFPSICIEMRGTLEIKPVPLAWCTIWEANCINTDRPGAIPQFEVNVLTCQVRLAVEATSDLRQAVANFFRPSLPMTVCP